MRAEVLICDAEGHYLGSLGMLARHSPAIFLEQTLGPELQTQNNLKSLDSSHMP